MSQFPSVNPNFRSEICRRDPSAIEWINHLSSSFEDLAMRWELTLDGHPHYGKTSMVLPVISRSRRAALKFVSPAGDIESEARALKLFAGKPIVELRESSIQHRALLLDRLPGRMLVDHNDPITAVEIAGEIAGQLGTIRTSPNIPTLAANAVGWPEGLRQQHERAIDAGIAVDPEIYQAARGIIEDLANFTSDTLTHGDLSLENIMSTSNGSWVAIDPLLLCGPIANEAHTVVRSLLPIIVESDSPRNHLEELTRRFCSAARIDYVQSQSISLARYVASYYWEAQNGGNPENIHRLRAASELTYQLLT